MRNSALDKRIAKALAQIDEQETLPYVNRFKDGRSAICEACGVEFEVPKGYYEKGEYSYCSDCCHW